MLKNDNFEVVQFDDRKYGFLDVNSVEVLGFEYDRIDKIDDGWYIVKSKGKFGFHNPTTNQAPEEWFDDIQEISGGVAKVKKNGKYGFYRIDKGEAPEKWFDEAEGLSLDGWSMVRDGSTYTYYNANTKTNCGRTFKKCEGLCLGWGVVQNDDGSYTYYSPATDKLCKKSFKKAWSLDAEGFGEVQIDAQRSYFNPEDEYVFKMKRTLDRCFEYDHNDHVADLRSCPEEFEHFPHASFSADNKAFIKRCLDAIAKSLQRRRENAPSPETDRETEELYSRISAKLAREKKVSIPSNEIPKAIMDLAKEFGEE